MGMTSEDGNRKERAERLPPSQIPPEYYDFEFYVSKERMLTYWYQIGEVLRKRPRHVLEIGVGNRIVSRILHAFDITTTTADINPSLRPDVVAAVSELDQHFDEGAFPMVLCARVLQHLPFSQFPSALRQLHFVTGRHLLLTIPVDTLRVYATIRWTGGKSRTLSLPLPLWIKRAVQCGRRVPERDRHQNFWKIGQTRETSRGNVNAMIREWFDIERAYQVPEDMSHAFFMLRRK